MQLPDCHQANSEPLATPYNPEGELERVQAIISNVAYPGLEFETRAEEGGRVFLRVVNPKGVCVHTGKAWMWKGRWWRLSPFMTPSEIVGTAFKAVITALEHEARESFTFLGEAIYDAHLNVYDLAHLRADRRLDARR